MSSKSSILLIYSFLSINIVVSILLIISESATARCYTSIFAFGDSLTDNGNLVGFSAPKVIHQGCLPNGETYFHHPTGRCCDGRLIIDFLAQSFGLPLLPPYVDVKEAKILDIDKGVNFAVAGAKALENSYYNVTEKLNISMRNQLDWFRSILPSFCGQKPNCTEQLQSSIVVLGPIGGNDYRQALFARTSMEEYRPHLVTDTIVAAVNELIELGIGTVMVPGIVPDGCLTINLKYFGGSDKSNYDESIGCIKSMNEFSAYHNELLQMKLDVARKLRPNATIIYADYYNAVLQLYRNPQKYGFVNTKDACCGAGGPYNYNIYAQCGDPQTTACPDPTVYVNWDGPHFTEAANRWITLALLEGPYVNPPIDGSCISHVANSKDFSRNIATNSF